MDKYRKCCEEVVCKVNDGSNSVESIKTFVMAQIGGYGLDKNKYIPTLISCLENSMGLWDRGCVDVFDLIDELSKLMDDTPAVINAKGEKVLRQHLSAVLTDEQLDLLVNELPTIKCVSLKKFWFTKYKLDGTMSAKDFFELCAAVVPHRKGRGWNSKRFQDCQ